MKHILSIDNHFNPLITSKAASLHNLSYESFLWEKGINLIAGVDEVGRGALAGPMVACALILRQEDLIQVHKLLTNNDIIKDELQVNSKLHKYLQIKDSKLLSPKKREELSMFIIQNCVCYSIVQISNLEIDKIGISLCTQKAFASAVMSLQTKPLHILTDAFEIRELPKETQTNIKFGDRFSITISAASIVAKVFRDNLMSELGEKEKYRTYNFQKHKGYGTKEHMDKIRQYGICDLHRQTFIHT